MSFFSNPGKTTELFSGKHEAFFALLICAAIVDGELDDYEINSINRIISHKAIFKNYLSHDLYTTICPIIEELGIDQVIQKAAEYLDQHEKKEVFVNSIDIYCANGIIDPAEKELLNEFAVALNLDNEWCQQAANIISMLYS